MRVEISILLVALSLYCCVDAGKLKINHFHPFIFFVFYRSFYWFFSISESLPDIFRFNDDPQKLKRDQRICDLCEKYITEFIQLVRANTSREVVREQFWDTCIKYSPVSELGCIGRVDHHLDAWIHIIKNRPKLSAGFICGIFNQDIGCEYEGNNDYWTVDIPPKPKNYTIVS